MARNFSSRAGVPTRERRTFHSTPSSSAARDKLDEPTYAVSKRGLPPEHPRLRVQAGPLGVVLDLDLSTELADQPVERAGVGSSHVGRGDHPERRPPRLQPMQLRFEQPKAVPLDEGAEQVHLIAGVELRPELGSQAGLAAGVGQQRSLGQRRGRPHILVG